MESQTMCESEPNGTLRAYAVDLEYNDGWGTTRTTILALDHDADSARERAEGKEDVTTVHDVRETTVLEAPDMTERPTAYAVDIRYRDGIGSTRTTVTVLDTDPDTAADRVEAKDDVLAVFGVREGRTLADWP